MRGDPVTMATTHLLLLCRSLEVEPLERPTKRSRYHSRDDLGPFADLLSSCVMQGVVSFTQGGCLEILSTKVRPS